MLFDFLMCYIILKWAIDEKIFVTHIINYSIVNLIIIKKKKKKRSFWCQFEDDLDSWIAFSRSFQLSILFPFIWRLYREKKSLLKLIMEREVIICWCGSKLISNLLGLDRQEGMGVWVHGWSHGWYLGLKRTPTAVYYCGLAVDTNPHLEN